MRTLVDRPHSPGMYTVHWTGTDDLGRRLDSGVSFCEIQVAGRFRDTRRLVLLK